MNGAFRLGSRLRVAILLATIHCMPLDCCAFQFESAGASYVVVSATELSRSRALAEALGLHTQSTKMRGDLVQLVVLGRGLRATSSDRLSPMLPLMAIPLESGIPETSSFDGSRPIFFIQHLDPLGFVFQRLWGASPPHNPFLQLGESSMMQTSTICRACRTTMAAVSEPDSGSRHH